MSDRRVAVLARAVVQVCAEEGEVVNERMALYESKRILAGYFQRDEKIDAMVRRKIESMSRRVVPGSAEWSVQYRRFFEEELRKHQS